MNAAIMAVGSELLGPSRLDTNSLAITSLLERYGVSLSRKMVVGDTRREIGREVGRALKDVEIVLITGGLGPTEDDCTKEAIAEAFDLPLVTDESLLEALRKRFDERGIEMPEVNARQARIFEGHETLANPRGTAPGFHIELDQDGEPKHIWIFPGVPWELEGMLEADLEPWLAEMGPGWGSVRRRIVRISGMTESAVEQKLEPFYAGHPGEPFTILSSESEIQIHLTANGNDDSALQTLDDFEAELRKIFGERLYGIDDDNLESVVGKLLKEKNATVATAESCTGGLLGSRITDVSGSSAYFLGGIVAYSREAKINLLGIEADLLDRAGQVSEDTAREMAKRVRERFGSTYGIGTTGIAGPSGGTEDKPVGTVHVAVVSPEVVKHRKFVLPPPRERVKRLTTQIALDLLRVTILRG